LQGVERLRHANSVASIKTWVGEAAWDTESEGDEPALQVGEWTFRGAMTVIYDGSATLANSTVRLGRATFSEKTCSGEEVRVAVKSVKLDSDAESVAMIRRESAILSELKDSHPNILPMLYCAETATELLLLTPFAPEGDLFTCIPNGTCIDEGELRRLDMQLLSALEFLHGRCVIHGDVKPQNVFLTETDDAMRAQLADFGLARKVPEGQDAVVLEGVQGSYGFVPPEVIDSSTLTFAADLFALGVMTFRYLGGHDPFFPPSQVSSPIEFDETCWEPVSAAARSFAVQLLAVDPGLRGSAKDLLASHEWFVAEEERLCSATRGTTSPPVAFVRFLSSEATRAAWVRRVSITAAPEPG